MKLGISSRSSEKPSVKFMETLMRRITILGRNLKDEEIEQIKHPAEEAGTAGDEIEVVDAVGEPDPDCEDEIVLILASPKPAPIRLLRRTLQPRSVAAGARFACGPKTRRPTPSRRTP
jgi:hypothetical protein